MCYTVLDSWQRSRRHHVRIDLPVTMTLSEGELHRKRQQGRGLLKAARQALEHPGGTDEDAHAPHRATQPPVHCRADAVTDVIAWARLRFPRRYRQAHAHE